MILVALSLASLQMLQFRAQPINVFAAIYMIIYDYGGRCRKHAVDRSNAHSKQIATTLQVCTVTYSSPF
jgi:hypothetical protein